MKVYLAALVGCIVVLFLAAWAYLIIDFKKIEETEYFITSGQANLVAKCDVSGLVVIGDSTAVADIIPSRTGPKVTDLGLNGATGIEAYYMAKAIMRCPTRPKAAIIGLVPATLSGNPQFPDPPGTFFWSEAVKYGSINFRDAMDVLRNSRRLDDDYDAGPKSLFDADFRIRAFLYSIKFPPYYFVELQRGVLGQLSHRSAKTESENALVYYQTVTDRGHHFFGTDATGGTVLDHDAYRPGFVALAYNDFYLRQMIRVFTKAGIPVYFVEPPRDATSASHYNPELVGEYQSYLSKVQQTEPGLHLVDGGFRIWDKVLFGDRWHLNLRGSLAYSDILRRELIADGLADLAYSDTAIAPHNLYGAEGDRAFWKEPAAIQPALGMMPPNLAYPGGSAWLFKMPADAATGAGSGVQAQDIALDADTDYAASIFVKPISAGTASLRLNWPGGARGGVTWDFKQQKIIYSGTAGPLNSGVNLCPGGWVELFLSARSGPAATSYPGPIVSLPVPQGATAYVFNVSLERGLWPTNYCMLQASEQKFIPLPH